MSSFPSGLSLFNMVRLYSNSLFNFKLNCRKEISVLLASTIIFYLFIRNHCGSVWQRRRHPHNARALLYSTYRLGGRGIDIRDFHSVRIWIHSMRIVGTLNIAADFRETIRPTLIELPCKFAGFKLTWWLRKLQFGI